MRSKQASQIIEGLGIQKSGYTRLLELAGQQKAAIEAGDDARLLEVIQNKERCLHNLREAEKALQRSADTLSDAERQALQQQARTLQNEVVGLMEKLIVVETECADILKSKKLEARGELTDLKNRKYSIQQYGMLEPKGTEFSGDA